MHAEAVGGDDNTTTTTGSTKDHCDVKTNHRWRKKIRATFPLMFIKPFHRSRPLDRDGPETVPEAVFEEITAAEMEATSADSQLCTETSEKREETPAVASPPKTRLKISLAQKEKLLNWDVASEDTERTMRQQKNQGSAETNTDKPHADSSQTPASSRSAFQVIANAFRRTFSVTSASSGANNAVRIRPKRDVLHRQRPMSEGAFSLTSLFSAAPPHRDEEAREERWASVGGDAWGAGRDLPSLLQQVSLKNRRDSGGVFSDDMGSLPRRRLDLFSSLRLSKREASESKGKEQDAQKEITTILTNLRNKASSQQNLDSSSDDEHENLPSAQKLCPERQKRKQEKTVAQQTKRDQLKRLHRAQVIQRQLEEVGEKQRDVEERGVTIEKVIRGETESSESSPLDDSDEAHLYQSWFKLVLEKNRLARYESELMIFAQELELEDAQSRLQQELRRRMARDDTKKIASELQQEQEILSEIMRTVGKRDTLVSLLEEQRLKERDEDRDLESLVLSKGYELNWAQAADDSWGAEDAAV